MSTINDKEYLKKVSRLQNVIRYQKLGLLCLILFSCSLLFNNYSEGIENRTITEKIEAFKTDAREELATVIAERAVFVKEKSWKGRLTLSDTEEVSYYDEEIKELECLNQTINLLEVKLTYP
jgi:hypothetical protein